MKASDDITRHYLPSRFPDYYEDILEQLQSAVVDGVSPSYSSAQPELTWPEMKECSNLAEENSKKESPGPDPAGNIATPAKAAA